MFDLYIDPATGDLAYQNGGLLLIKDTNKRVRQELETTLRAFRGEWFNNVQFGGINRDYIGRVGITKLEVDAWYRSVILANPEVLELVFFESTFNRFSRQYDLEFVVRTKKGEERVTVGLRPDQEVTYVVPDQEQYLPPTTPSIKVMSAFISGTSEVSAILSKDAISFVSAPIAGVSTVTATAERLFQAVTITGTSSVSAGSGVKPMSATISGSGDVAAYISTVMAATLSATSFNWEPAAPAAPELRIVSNTLQPAVENHWRQMSRVKQSAYNFGADHYSQIVVSSYSSGNYGLLVRSQPSSINLKEVGYLGRYVSPTNSFVIQRLNTDTAINLGTYSAPALSYPLTMRLEAVGTTIRLLINSVNVLEVTDSLFATGQPGVQASVSSSFELDDYQAGNIAETIVFTDNFNRADEILNVTDVRATLAKVMSSTMASSGTISAVMSKQLSATISGSADITAAVSYGGGTVIAGTSSVTASVSKVMAATIAGTSLVSAGGAYSMVATITSSGAISASIAKPSSATIAGTSAVTSTARKVFTATISGTSTTSAVVVKPLSATITSTHNITASIQKGGSIVITGTSTLSGNIRKVKYTSANISGTSNVVGTFSKVKQMGAIVSGSSTTTATGMRFFQPNSVSGSGTVSGSLRKAMSSTIAGTGSITAAASKRAIATISGSGSVVGTIGKVKAMSATILNGNGLTSGYIFPGGLYDLEAIKTSRTPQTLYPLNDYTTADVREYVNSGTNLATYGAVALVGQQGMIRDGSRTASVKANSLNSIEPVAFLYPSDVLPVAPATGTGKLGIAFWTTTPATLTDASLMSGFNFDGTTNWPYWDLRITPAGAILFRLYSFTAHNNSAYIQWSSNDGVIISGWNTFIAVSLDTTQVSNTSKCQIYIGNWPNVLADRMSTVQVFGGYVQSLNPQSDYDSIQVARNYVGTIEKISTYNNSITETNARLLYNSGQRTLHDHYVFESNPSSYVRFESYTDYSYQSNVTLTGGFRLSYNGNGVFAGTELTRGSLGGISGINSSPRCNFPATNTRQKTFSVWVRPTAFHTQDFIMGMTDDGNGLLAGRSLFTLGLNSTGVLSLITEGSTGSFSEAYGSNPISLNNTYHIAAILDLDAANVLRLFINGVECVSTVSTTDGSWSASENLPTGTQFIMYGSDSVIIPNVTTTFSGTIERAATFESVLSDAKIISLYDSGKI